MPRNISNNNRQRSSTATTNSSSTNNSNRAKKRVRPLDTSDEEAEVAQDHRRESNTGSIPKPRDCNKCRREIGELKDRLKASECVKNKLELRFTTKKEHLAEARERITAQDRDLERLKKEKVRLKKNVEKLTKEKEEAEKLHKKWKKKADTYRAKISEMEAEKSRLESKLSNLKLQDGSGKSSSFSGPGPSTSAAAKEPTGLFQDMMDNFSQLVETQLQCAVCSELFVEAVSVNCGHTFCEHCIGEWRKKKNNCPVCRADIRASAPCKVMDEYVNKVYEQFISEEGRVQRNILKEERVKLKSDAAAAAASNRARRAGGSGVNQLVNIVLNRRREEADSSLDSDDTIELHLSGNRDSDSDVMQLQPRANLRSLLATIGSDSDSSDETFVLGRNPFRDEDDAISSDEEDISSSSSSSSESVEEEEAAAAESENERRDESDRSEEEQEEEEEEDDRDSDDDESSSDFE